MANRRMISREIVDSDVFLSMPDSAQNLYFHMNMRADDDGFVDSPKKIVRLVNASEDDLRILLSKRYLLAFDSGLIVIKHWRLHNTIQKDRYHATKYQEEFTQLFIKENGAYTDHDPLLTQEAPKILAVSELDTGCIQNGSKTETEIRLDYISQGKDRLEEGGAALPVSAKPPAPISHMKEELADYWQSIITAIQPCSTWANFGRERKALNDIASRTKLLFGDVIGITTTEKLADMVFSEFLEMRDNTRDKLIRAAPIIPSKILQFWPEITTSMAEKRRAEQEAQGGVF